MPNSHNYIALTNEPTSDSALTDTVLKDIAFKDVPFNQTALNDKELLRYSRQILLDG